LAAVVLLEGGRGGVSLVTPGGARAARILMANLLRATGVGETSTDERARAWLTYCAVLDRVPVRALRGDVSADAAGAADAIERMAEEV
jgi:hypothetical protein